MYIYIYIYKSTVLQCVLLNKNMGMNKVKRTEISNNDTVVYDVVPLERIVVCLSFCLCLSFEKDRKRTTPRIPTWSPTVVLTWPDHA